MKQILIAGATGYLGHFVARAFKEQGYYTKVLVRNPDKFKAAGIPADEVLHAEITHPDSLLHICRDVDIVFSSVGITKQKDGLTYHDVDFQANMNLLQEAIKSGVKKFVYIAVLNGEKFRNLKICEEKERFVTALKKSAIDYVVIRPNGYYSDMVTYFEMARKGKVYLLGNGNNRMNPISGEDLAKFCVANIQSPEKELEVGGPETFTHNQMAKLAFRICSKKEKIIHIPRWIPELLVRIARIFTSSKIYGPFEFVETVLTRDMIAPAFGRYRLGDYFKTLQNNH